MRSICVSMSIWATGWFCLNLLFSWPKVMLGCSSQSVNGITPQGDNSFLFLSGLIHILPYGTWLPVTHVSFQSFQMN